MKTAGKPEPELVPSDLPKGQARRRQRIIDEAYRLIAANGQENVQIREIAESSGVALGTAYRYFGSKERLVAEVYAKWLDERKAELAKSAAKGSTNTERMRVLALRMLDLLTGDPHFLRLARQDLRSTTSPEANEIINRSEREWIDLFRSALRDIDPRDGDSIALTVTSVVVMELDRYLAGVISIGEANRDVAKAVKMVLEFRDPAIEAAERPGRRR